MRDLPSGTVTFLFTDVEGSTKLLHDLGAESYADLLAEHRRILREAFVRHGGVEVDTQGDAFFVAFPTATGALEAAREAREALADGPVAVRMGIHTGTPHMAEEGYVGRDVHRAARIAAAGHGGQVLVSAATAALLESGEFRDLGEHRLKDLSAPERIFQLGEDDFSPLKTLYRTNLPIPATPFLGRERELGEVERLLARGDVRLLTLTGPGGTGKTRLALQAAAESSERYPDGVFWVPLAPLRDSSLVLEEAGQALGASDEITDHIADKRLLLLLDNFEHLIDAAAGLASLLARCPNLELLVTSRELLQLPGEQAYPVPPLELQDGVELFTTRAKAVNPSFGPDEAVPTLCAALDNLPLALELAAARIRLLSPEQLLERLSTRLDLLRAGRGVDARQQTLRATIEWSHELLDTEEQQLFARLAVFTGGCTLAAAEQICQADLDTLQALVDKSLVRLREGDRFWMLETIREYALERLETSGEAEELRRRHAECFLALAERAYDDRLASAAEWLSTLDHEHGNLRAALDWAAITSAGVAIQLAGAVAPYWSLRGRVAETRERLAGALATYDRHDRLRARALTHLGELEEDEQTALRYLNEALALWRELGDARGEGYALESIGWTHDNFGNYAAAQAAHEESLGVRRGAGMPNFEAWRSVAGLCHVLVATGEVERAERMAAELLSIGESNRAARTEQIALHFLADCSLIAGDHVEAERRYVRALDFAYRLGLTVRTIDELLGVAMSLAGQGKYAEAVRLASVSYAQQEELQLSGDRWWVTMQEWFIGGARAELPPAELAASEQAGRDADFECTVDEVLTSHSS